MTISCVQRQANGNEDEEAELVKSWEKDKVWKNALLCLYMH